MGDFPNPPQSSLATESHSGTPCLSTRIRALGPAWAIRINGIWHFLDHSTHPVAPLTGEATSGAAGGPPASTADARAGYNALSVLSNREA